MLSFQDLFSKLIGTSAPEVPVPDPRSFSREVWVQEGSAFTFRCENQRFGDRASFCVTQSALQDLEPELSALTAAAAFEALRPVIYGAALERMRVASPMVQHVLTAHQLRAIQRKVSGTPRFPRVARTRTERAGES